MWLYCEMIKNAFWISRLFFHLFRNVIYLRYYQPFARVRVTACEIYIRTPTYEKGICITLGSKAVFTELTYFFIYFSTHILVLGTNYPKSKFKVIITRAFFANPKPKVHIQFDLHFVKFGLEQLQVIKVMWKMLPKIALKYSRLNIAKVNQISHLK